MRTFRCFTSAQVQRARFQHCSRVKRQREAVNLAFVWSKLSLAAVTATAASGKLYTFVRFFTLSEVSFSENKIRKRLSYFFRFCLLTAD